MCQQEGSLNEHYSKQGRRNEARPPQQCQWSSDDGGVFGSDRRQKAEESPKSAASVGWRSEHWCGSQPLTSHSSYGP